MVTKVRWLVIGIIVYLVTEASRFLVSCSSVDGEIQSYFSADYLPPFLPFIASTGSFGLIIISAFMLVPERFGLTKLSEILVKTGRMTLTHYVLHLTLGFFTFAVLTGRTLSLSMMDEPPVAPWVVLTFSCGYFAISCTFSYFWALKFKAGPLESLMRRIAG